MRLLSTITATLAACTLLVAVATAQERAAGQTQDAQLNWSTLSNQFTQVDTQNKALATTVTAIINCNKQGKMWNGSSCQNPNSNSDSVLSGNYAWYGYGYVPLSKNSNLSNAGCYSSAASAACPWGWVQIALDACAGDGHHIAVLCAELTQH
jgi:hypothetical protein